MHNTEEQRNSRSAIAALVLGILSLLGGIIFTGIPALFLGYKGRAEVHRSNGVIKGLGMAWAGIIIGWLVVGLTIISVVLVLGLWFFGRLLIQWQQ